VTDADAIGRVDLAQAESMAKCACCSPDREIIHGDRSSESALTRQ